MTLINPEIFREYDIRGIAETDLNPEFMVIFSRALNAYFQEQGKTRVIIGRDNRLSSKRIRDELAAGLVANGCNVVDIGIATTPLFYYARLLYGIDAGVMITASHNPAEFNGFKIALGPGTIYGAEIQQLKENVVRIGANRDLPTPVFSNSESQLKSLEYCEPHEPYLTMLAEKIKLRRGLKVAVDCGNGTAGVFAVEYLEKLGCEVIPLFCESDGNFPNHHPDPVSSANLRFLKEAVLQHQADLGIAFDGDGDRLGVVDETGRIIWGDELMALFWREILPRHPGAPCIVEVKCSQALVDEIERLGGRPEFYKTGHSLIKARMREIGAVFTGEMSGHMFFADEYFGFDDAFYAAGRLLRIMAVAAEPLSGLLATIPKYFATAETRIPCSDAAKFQVVERLRDRFQKTRQVITIDGARVLFEEGWGLVRASNTQPALVARCEARTEMVLVEITEQITEALRLFPEVGEFEWEY